VIAFYACDTKTGRWPAKPKLRRKIITGYKKTLFIGMIVIALGVVLTTTLSGKLGSIGIVVIALGGLLFIIGMRGKKSEDATREKK
jgi:hypothetical protein